MDASKHMWPGDMKAIFDRVNNLATDHGFPSGARPFIYMEVIDNGKWYQPTQLLDFCDALVHLNVSYIGGEAVGAAEYVSMGRVTEFKVRYLKEKPVPSYEKLYNTDEYLCLLCQVCANIGNVFRKYNGQKLSYLKNWGKIQCKYIMKSALEDLNLNRITR